MHSRDTLFIGGDFVAPKSTATIDVISPFTEQAVATVPEANEADVDRAVAAAREALETGPWPHTSAEERAEMLTNIANAIMARQQDLAQLITGEMGSPITFSELGQVLASSMVFHAFADVVREFPFEEQRSGFLGQTIVRREPVGVAGAIIPWNVPLFITALKFGAAVAAGVPVVLKPAPETPLDAYLFGEILNDVGLPPGMFNVVPGGREIGEYLVRHPGVDKIAFTGSTAAGRKIGAICGEQLKRVTLELGGKSASIILDDADLATSIPLLMPNAIMNNGQACLAQTRILAPQSRYSEVADAVVAFTEAMKVGDPFDHDVTVGPLVAERQRERVEGYLEIGREEGAKVAIGGGRPKDLDSGWFVEPTVFTEVDNNMRIAQEEIFGPVVVVIPYEDEDDAVGIANDSGYGLSGSVFTADTEHGIDVARRVRTGTYGVNAIGTMDMKQPFGGYKSSGVGRECGPEGVDAYCEVKTIVLPMDYTPSN